MAWENDNISVDASGNDELDMVLKEAARLAAQMRGVNGSKVIKDDEILPEQPSFLIRSDLSTIEPTGIPTDVDIPHIRSLEGEFEGPPHLSDNASAASGNTLRRAAVRGEEASSDEVAAAIRASEEMARALEAFGALSGDDGGGGGGGDKGETDTPALVMEPLAEEHDAPVSTPPKESSAATPDKEEVEDDDDVVVPVRDYSISSAPRPATSPAAELRDYSASSVPRPATTPAAELRDYSKSSTPRPATTPAAELRDYSTSSSPRPATTTAAEHRGRNASSPTADAVEPTKTHSKETSGSSKSKPAEPDQVKTLAPAVVESDQVKLFTPERPSVMYNEKSIALTPPPNVVAPATPSLAEAGAGASPWKFYSMGLASPRDTASENKENAPVVASLPSPLSVAAAINPFGSLAPGQTTWNDVAAKSSSCTSETPITKPTPLETKQPTAEAAPTPVGETLARGNKSRELREKLRQTEAQYARLKSSRSNLSLSSHHSKLSEAEDEDDGMPDWAKLAKMTSGKGTTPSDAAVAAKGELTWDKIDDAKDGDDDYAPLRDYSSRNVSPIPIPVVDSKASGTSSGASGINWTKLDEPQDGDDDFVPVRGVGGGLPREIKNRATASKVGTRASETQSKLKDTCSDSECGLPGQQAKLRTPSNVKWERVDFVEHTDDDYVPLKDYSKVPSCGITTSSASTSRSLSPNTFDDGYDDDYGMIISAFQSKSNGSEGPTAFELKRRNLRRKEKNKRLAAAGVFLGLLVGTTFIYSVQKRSPPPPVKRGNYKTKHRPVMRAAVDHPPKITQPGDAKTTEPPPSPKSTTQNNAKTPTRTEKATSSVPDAPRGAREAVHHRHQHDVVQERRGMDTTARHDSHHHHPMTEEGSSDDPQPNICLIPFGYLVAQKCANENRPQRLENFLQNMFQ